MQYQIDQSIRIEQTNKATIIGLADESGQNTYSVVIPANIKRQIETYHRNQGLPKIFMVNLFIASVILVLKKSKFKVNQLTIDIEYPGYEVRIIKSVHRLSPQHPSVSFSVIGKHSPAHQVAYGVYIKKRRSNYVASYQDLITIIKQRDRGL